jgi:hypothetical protein
MSDISLICIASSYDGSEYNKDLFFYGDLGLRTELAVSLNESMVRLVNISTTNYNTLKPTSINSYVISLDAHLVNPCLGQIKPGSPATVLVPSGKNQHAVDSTVNVYGMNSGELLCKESKVMTSTNNQLTIDIPSTVTTDTFVKVVNVSGAVCYHQWNVSPNRSRYHNNKFVSLLYESLSSSR